MSDDGATMVGTGCQPSFTKIKRAEMNTQEQDAHDSMMAAMTLPKYGTCIVDDTHAVMDQSYFNELLSYDHSMPTGCFIGKRWKRLCLDGHYMLEFEKHPTDEKMARTRSRKIIVVESQHG